jgi:hypothetical protein
MKTIDNLKGGRVEWQGDFEASLDDNGSWTASHSFKCRSENIFEVMPQRGAPCTKDGWALLKLSTIRVTEEAETEWTQVFCTYKGTEYTFGGDEGTSYEPTYSTSVVAQSEPIEAHKKFKDFTLNEWSQVALYKEGKIIRDPKDNEKFKKAVLNTANNEWKFTEEFTPTDIQLILFKALDKGFTSYYSPRITHVMRYTSNKPISSGTLNSIGDKDAPPNAPSVGTGREWLFMGANSDQTGDVHEIELEWLLSGSEGWDSEFYD